MPADRTSGSASAEAKSAALLSVSGAGAALGRGRVRRRRCRRPLVDRRAAPSDEVDDRAVGGAVGSGLAGERGGAVDEGDRPGRAAHVDGAADLRGRQVGGAAGARGLADEIVLAGDDRAGERGDLPGGRPGRAGRDVLHRPAGDALVGAAAVGQLDEVVAQGRAAVAASAVDLVDDDPGGRGRVRRDGEADSGTRQGGGGRESGEHGAGPAHGILRRVGTWCACPDRDERRG